MKGKYDRNYTDKGYLMNYKKLKKNYLNKNEVFQFKIELQEISPMIWRRILVPANYNFWDLHVAIQDSMGWFDCHLHHFEIRGKGKRKETHIGISDFDKLDDLEEVFPGWEIPVIAYFNGLGVEAKYIYDYGDYWLHRIRLEGYIYQDHKIEYPICIGGERACPPEDCGGELGYYEMLKILSDPDSDDYKRMKTWAGENWNPEKFLKNEVKFDNPYRRWKSAFLQE